MYYRHHIYSLVVKTASPGIIIDCYMMTCRANEAFSLHHADYKHDISLEKFVNLQVSNDKRLSDY